MQPNRKAMTLPRGQPEYLAARIRRAQSPVSRINALRKLVALDAEDCRSLLALVLETDPDASVRIEAADYLGGIGNAHQVDLVAQVMAQDVSPEVRTKAADAFATMVRREGLDRLHLLLERLEKEMDRSVKDGIYNALRNLNDPRTECAFLTAIQTEDSATARFISAMALRDLPRRQFIDEEATQIIRTALIREPFPEVRAQLVESFGWVSGADALACLVRYQKEDENESVRYSAMLALSQFPAEQGMNLLAWSISNEPARANRVRAIELLKRAWGPAAVPCLREALNDQNLDVRRELVLALAGLGETGLTESLLEIAMHGSDDHQIAAFQNMAGLREWRFQTSNPRSMIAGLQYFQDLVEPQVIPLAKQTVISNANPMVRISAAFALAAAGSDDALLAFRSVLKDRSGKVRGMILEGAQLLSGHDARILAEGFLADPSAPARSGALKTLGSLKNPQLIPTFLGLLSDDRSPLVREEAANALAKFSNAEACDGLIQSIQNDRNYRVRMSAIANLKVGWDATVRVALEAQLRRDEFAVNRQRAAWGLLAGGDPCAIPALAEALDQDQSTLVRTAAAEALGALGHPDALPYLGKAESMDCAPQVVNSARMARRRILSDTP